MAKQPTLFFMISALVLSSLLLPTTAGAAGGKGSIRLSGQVSPILSGAAGSGLHAPDYVDAFDTGFGGGGEFAWKFCRWFSGVAGLGYEVYYGDKYEEISFSNLEVIPVYLGGKFHLLQNVPAWDLYLRVDIGGAHLSSVDVSYQGLKGRYWDSSWAFLFDFGAGAEYRWGQWGASIEVKARYLDSPDPALGEPSDSDALWSLPVTLGLNYYF